MLICGLGQPNSAEIWLDIEMDLGVVMHTGWHPEHREMPE